MLSEVSFFLTYHYTSWLISAERPTELREVDVDVVTFGQYMRPTKRHMKVDRYVEPAEFDRWKQIAENMGFLYVASGPLVRSSYKVGVGRSIHGSLSFILQAGEYFIENVLRNKGAEKRSRKLSARHMITDSDSTLLA